VSGPERLKARAALGELAEETDGERLLQFAVAKGLAYPLRALAILGLALTGVVAQAATLNPLAGVPFLLAAVILAWVSGLDHAADRRALELAQGWEAAPLDRLDEIAATAERLARWDRSPVEATNCCGSFGCLVATLAVAGAALLALDRDADIAAAAIAIDGGLLLVLQWFSGTRSFLGQPDLLVKVKHLRETLSRAQERLERLGTLQTQLKMTGKEERSFPTDVRLTVAVPDAPPEFLSLQVQVVLNHVQGTPYPYLYAVVVAKEGTGLLEAFERVEAPKGVIHERKTQEGVDVAIVRQYTTRTSGYHTKPGKSAVIVENAALVAERFLGR